VEARARYPQRFCRAVSDAWRESKYRPLTPKAQGKHWVNSRRELLAFICSGRVEIDSAVLICFFCRWKVETGKGNFLGPLRGKIPERLAYDGVIFYFLCVLIAENQYGGGVSFHSLRRLRGRRVSLTVSVLVGVPAHSLLVEALLIHLVGEADLVLLILIVGRIGIPPPVGIDSTIEVRITEATAESETIMSEVAGADS